VSFQRQVCQDLEDEVLNKAWGVNRKIINVIISQKLWSVVTGRNCLGGLAKILISRGRMLMASCLTKLIYEMRHS